MRMRYIFLIIVSNISVRVHVVLAIAPIITVALYQVLRHTVVSYEAK